MDARKAACGAAFSYALPAESTSRGRLGRGSNAIQEPQPRNEATGGCQLPCRCGLDAVASRRIGHKVGLRWKSTLYVMTFTLGTFRTA